MEACPSENDLAEYVEALAPAEARGKIADHLDACDACRAVVAALARNLTARPQASAPASGDLVPAEFVREALRRDAPRRERLVTGFFATFSGLGLAAYAVYSASPVAAVASPRIGAAALGLAFAYQLAVHLALRRGWFHPALPYANVAMEVSVFFAMALAKPEAVRFVGAAPIALGLVVVFSAVRADPRLSILAGVVAAAEWVLVLAFTRDRPGAPPPLLFGEPVVLSLVAGAAGALVARYFVANAESALHDMRSQDLFGKYILHERIGLGGMGEVYRATYCPEGGFVRTVAVKRVRADRAENAPFVDAFRAEARLSASLAHPNLVQVHDFGRFRGAWMIAMEWIDGVSLAALLRERERPLEIGAVLFIGAELASALEYLHARKPGGLVHCDVNPPNVLLSRVGEVKLADFGVARALSAHGGGFAGKVAYAAPEQLRGGKIGPRTDFYGLGLTLKEALRGEVPAALEALVLGLTADDPDARVVADLRARLLALRAELAPGVDGERLVAEAVAEIHERP